ncbi:MAG: ribosome maturation factor RimP [Bryobacteraceae bacterium]|nr:ribosome maturation factor RimP [Bryobacteraceae bacterium]
MECRAPQWAKAHFFVAGIARQTVKEETIHKVRQIAERVAQPEGLEIVEVEFSGSGRNRVLRIFIDKPGGVSHSDCEFISQQVGTILDVEDAVPGGSYTLEVSSPGLERKLSRPEDFVRFQGRKVKILLREPVENRRHWEGVLAGFGEGNLTLEAEGGRTVRFTLQQVQRANLKFEW